MVSEAHERTLAVFDAFLRYAREGSRAAAARAAAVAAMASTATGGVTEPDPPTPVQRDPAMTTGTPVRGFDEEATKVSRLSQAMASSLAPLPAHGSLWEEPTRERPDVVREMRANPEAQAEDLSLTLPDGPYLKAPNPLPAPARLPTTVHEERSIIVEDDSFTEPELSRDAITGGQGAPWPSPGAFVSSQEVPGPMPVERFCEEMAVLIKYGHAAQAAEMTERWISAHPDDLTAHRRIAEFELAWLDRDRAIRHFIALVSRLLERGERGAAGAVVHTLRRELPDDDRVGALAQRVGRS